MPIRISPPTFLPRPRETIDYYQIHVYETSITVQFSSFHDMDEFTNRFPTDDRENIDGHLNEVEIWHATYHYENQHDQIEAIARHLLIRG